MIILGSKNKVADRDDLQVESEVKIMDYYINWTLDIQLDNSNPIG